MSQENVELVRQTHAAWNQGDMDAMLAVLHPDFEFVTSGAFPGLDPVYAGHDGFKRFWRDFRGAWQSLHLAIHELRECDERVIALVTFKARGRDGLEVTRQTGSVWAFRDGLTVRIENFEAWAEALEAAGLRE